MASNSILVIGGGFAGITAALEAAELGHEVFIIEKTAFLGGRVMQLNKYFPKLCPPSCGLEIQYQRIKNNPKVKFFTLAEVSKVEGSAGNYDVTVTIQPRHSAPNSPDLSELCSALTSETPSDFEFGLTTRKAVYMDAPFAFPQRYVVDKASLSDADLALVAENEYLDLSEEARVINLNVGSIVIATGWKPYDVTRLTNLGAGEIKNCITNMQMERIASAFGPTQGKVVRPSDGRAPKKVAFVQCAGSRDENHLGYCSYICCMASLKQAQYVREQNPGADITIFYIDLRTPGLYENFAAKILADEKVHAVKGKVAAVEQDKAGDDVWLTVEDAVTGTKSVERFDLVVLATGMQPSLAENSLPFDVPVDAEGFIIGGEERGIFAAGCAKQPLDVMKSAQSGTGAAMKAVQTVRGR
ncbi:MAG: FAD-dependent oxidoreductase [Desulfomicrobium sp.]|nr:FAD-dependent oxidoreductase [Desulfomicrobium sp.]NLV96540.1 CoB--CoM heterodisulfide reductase iron-sulfur subunit A family protein [Desulfovibrionales bacterium]